MPYLSFKPWIGENYHKQKEKVLILIRPEGIAQTRKSTNGVTYSEIYENSVIDFVNDFTHHRVKRESFKQLTQILAKQEIENVNLYELWSKYACYTQYLLDLDSKELVNERTAYESQAFHKLLQQLHPDKIIVASHVTFDDLPKCHVRKDFKINKNEFDYELNGQKRLYQIDDSWGLVKGYQINHKIIYALRLPNPIVASARKYSFIKLSQLIEIGFDNINCIENF